MKQFDDTARFCLASYSVIVEKATDDVAVLTAAKPCEFDHLHLRGSYPESMQSTFINWEIWQYINAFGMPIK